MKQLFILIMCYFPVSVCLHAEVTLDGTLGKSGALTGPSYQIGADLGQQHGSNLFHSFQDFNLQSYESATFSGPNGVQNIISRVTGGHPSTIDGLIRSTIPNADMYFLNPYGILFGPNARLDVQGGFHASTAHYLRLQDGGRFAARSPTDSFLTVASVEAFGFLDNTIAPLSVTGYGEVNSDWQERATGLAVPEGKTLSLIGGDLTLSQGTFFNSVVTQNGQETTLLTELPSLAAPFGRINLASVAQAGEVLSRPMGLDLSPSLSATTQLGHITLSDHTLLDVSGPGGGSIFIRGGQFVARDSRLWSNTHGRYDGGIIDIQADSIAFLETARIEAKTEAQGRGTDVHLRATESITFSSLKNGKIDPKNRAGIDSWSGFYGKIPSAEMGDTGNTVLEAKNIEFREAGHIDNLTYGGGKGGDVTIRATNNVIISGKISPQDVSGFGLMSFGDGQGGNLLIEANNISFEGETETIVGPYSTGDGGNVTLRATERLSLTGTGNRMGMGSRVYTANFLGQGNAGNISVFAKDIVMTDGGMLNASTFSSGNAGNIEIHASGTATIIGADQLGVISQIATKSNAENEGTSAGKGGNLFIEAGHLILKDGGQIATGSTAGQSRKSQDSGHITVQVNGTIEISGVNPYGENATGFGSGIYATSRGLEGNTGKAGHITLRADNLILEEGGVIKTSTNNDAPGGNLNIEVRDSVHIHGDASHIALKPPALQQMAYLQNFSPTHYNQSTSGIYAASESTSERGGPSGDLTLAANHLHLSDKGQISTTSAGGGRAGQLHITASDTQLETGAFIGSESQLPNTYTFANQTERDQQMLTSGDVIEVADVGNGKAEQYVYTGSYLLRVNPLAAVPDVAALQELSKRYSVNSLGEIIEVKNAGNGQPARFFYKNGNWIKVKEESVVTLENMTELNQTRNLFFSEQMPYQEGQAIHVEDAGNGKSADFIYLHRNLGARSMGFPIRVKSFAVSDFQALSQLGEQFSLQEGDLAKVSTTEDIFVYQNQSWMQLNSVRTLPNRAALNSLILTQTGNIAQLTDGGNGQPAHFIYTGKDWIPLGQEFQVIDLAQRDKLSAQSGDIAKVIQTENGESESFFYVEGHWQKRAHGGETGAVTVTAHNLHLSDSAITTEGVSEGEGNITLKVDQLLLLEHSQITASVRGGLEKGGNIVIENPTFVVLNRGQIRAQADEGQGGNIRIVAEQFISTPDSLVSASSNKGISGHVVINSPDNNLAGNLLTLSKELRNAPTFSEFCKSQALDKQSHFKVTQHRRTHPDPQDWQVGPQ